MKLKGRNLRLRKIRIIKKFRVPPFTFNSLFSIYLSINLSFVQIFKIFSYGNGQCNSNLNHWQCPFRYEISLFVCCNVCFCAFSFSSFFVILSWLFIAYDLNFIFQSISSKSRSSTFQNKQKICVWHFVLIGFCIFQLRFNFEIKTVVEKVLFLVVILTIGTFKMSRHSDLMINLHMGIGYVSCSEHI